MKITQVFKMDKIAWNVTVDGNSVTVFVPSREFIDDLKVGDVAPNCFASLSTVNKITYVGKRQKDGAHFIGYYTPLGDNGSVSMSLMENEIVRAPWYPWTSAQFDEIERAIHQHIASRVTAPENNKEAQA